MMPPIERLRALPPEELTEFLLVEPEGQWFDRKSSRVAARDLAKTLVAMANSEGGMIVVGLSDGRCEGVDQRPSAHHQWRQAGVDFTQPPVRFELVLLECITHRGTADHLLVLIVPPGNQPHTTARDEAYLRVGDEDRRLSFEQRVELRYDRGDTTFEVMPALTYGGPATLDEERLVDYAQRIGHPDRRRLLQARELSAPDGQPLTGGVLLFGAQPQRLYPEAFVRVLRYSGKERLTGTVQNLVGDVRCEGTLPQQIDDARLAIRDVLPKQKALGPDGRFGWFDIVPEEVWLEALVNAVIHRAYSNFGDHIRVAVCDDRVEVSSPGRFPGLAAARGLTDLANVPRFARNPRIARVMADLAYGQELGEGLRRMAAVMEASGRRRPLLRQTAGGVEISLFGTRVQPDELQEMPALSRDLYEHLVVAGRLRTGELINLCGRSRPRVLQHLYWLEARGLVRRVGNGPTDPHAYWTAEKEN